MSNDLLIDLAIERAILSTFINNCLETNLAYHIEKLEPEDFYKLSHQKIFEAIQQLQLLNNPIDFNFVERKLNSEFHSDLLEVFSTNEITNLNEYIKELKGISLRRKYLQFSHTIKHQVYNNEILISEFQENIDREYYKVIGASIEQEKSIHTAADVIELLVTNNKESEKTKIFSSMDTLNLLTGGFEEGDLIVIAARPSMGKSSFATTLQWYFATLSIGSFAISLEMTKVQWMTNLLAIHSQELKNNIASNNIQNQSNFKKSVDFIKKSSIFIDDSTGIYWNQLSKRIRQFLKENPTIKDIFIDHLDKILLPKISRQDIELGEITTGLKNIAKEFGIRVYLLHQLNRESEKREDKRPMLSDLKNSGCIEADADKIIFLYNNDYYKRTEKSLVHTEFIVAKNRNGLTGTAHVMFDKARAYFYEPEKNEKKVEWKKIEKTTKN